MNLIMKPMTPRMPIPSKVILVLVVKSSRVGRFISFMRRPTDSNLPDNLGSDLRFTCVRELLEYVLNCDWLGRLLTLWLPNPGVVCRLVGRS
jgi:hypothetical protein